MENYKYIKIPVTISLKEIQKNNYCFAPSKYSRFTPNKDLAYMTLNELITESVKKTKINKNFKYKYSEIGDINVKNGFVDNSCYYGINMPSDNPKIIQKHDIVVSTVRTYRGGIGYITDDSTNQCCSPAMIVIKDVKPIVTKEYLFAILRNEFFIEQVLGFLNRGIYPRLDKEAIKHIVIPIPKEKSTLDYITALIKAYLNKIKLIKERHQAILELIKKELLDNQKDNVFSYNLPTIEEIQNIGRLDTGIYSQQFKEIAFIINNYQNGVFFVGKDKIHGGNTPSIRYIDDSKNLKYRWVTPTICSDFGTLSEERINFVGTNNINSDCIVIVNRTSKGGIGEYVGIAGFYNYQDFGKGHHNQGIYRITGYDKTQLLFMLAFLNCSVMRKFCANLSVGSKMKELKIKQILQIPFPNFPTTKQQEIAKLYHSSITYDLKNVQLDNFLALDNEFNSHAGIYELDKSAKQLQFLLDKAIENIIHNKSVEISFV